MITVSDSFKAAIKSTTREIKGYVEALYDIKNKNVQTFEIFDRNLDSDVADITTIEQLKDKWRVVEKYACFDKDYFKLDGSVVLPHYGENQKAGYISNLISNENGSLLIDDNDNGLAIKISCSEKYTTKGFSIYFDDESYPTEIQYDNGLEIITIENDSDYLFIDQEWDFNNGSFWIYVTKLNKPQNRVRITEIDLGISKVYKNRELINFSVIEEVDKLNIEIPSNELELNVSNYENLFDYNNPKGIVKYLSNNSKIVPHIGILTEDEGVTYIQCGIFYLRNWKANNDDTVTIIARDFFDSLKEIDYSFYDVLASPSYYIKKLCQEWGIVYNRVDAHINGKITGRYVPAISKLEKLQLLGIVGCGFLNASRYNSLIFSKIPEEVSTRINLIDMLKKPVLEEQVRIKGVKIKDYGLWNADFSKNKEVLFCGNFEIYGKKKVYINFDNSVYTGSFDDLKITNGTLISSNITTESGQFYRTSLVVLEIKSPGIAEVELKGRREAENDTYVIYNNRDQGEEITIENRYIYETQIQTFAPLINQYYQDNDDKFKATIEYFGDPSIECGDLLEVETEYGYKNIFVSKHQLKFDGGLTGLIEGTCN